MIRQQPEGHDTFASVDSCFCAAKVAPVAISVITASVNWLSDKRYLCVRIKSQIGPLLRSKSGPGGTLYHYGLRELAQRQAVFVRQDKPSVRAIKSDRAKVVMTVGCISITFDIPNYIYILREIVNSATQNLNAKIAAILKDALSTLLE